MDESSIFISAGEQSGDNAGALLISALQKKKNSLAFFGLGGNRMKSTGQMQLANVSELAVMGFWEVARRYLFFRKLFNRCLGEIKKRKTHCVILIDYPGFNLRLAKEVKKLGITVIYYISPQVWAWGEKRVNEIRRNVDRMICILPFEKKFYEKHDVECDFVGHYLLEDINSEYISSSVPADGHIGVFPGSRKNEIEKLLPEMIGAVKRFNKEFGTKAVIAGVTGAFDYDSLLKNTAEDSIRIVYDNPRKVIYESSLVLTKSGTATLETAIIGRPMVVCYKTGFLNYQIARRLVKIDKIAMANLVLDEKVVPELIQSEADSNNMYQKLKELFTDESRFDSIKQKLNSVPQILGGAGASENAATIIADYLN